MPRKSWQEEEPVSYQQTTWGKANFFQSNLKKLKKDLLDECDALWALDAQVEKKKQPALLAASTLHSLLNKLSSHMKTYATYNNSPLDPCYYNCIDEYLDLFKIKLAAIKPVRHGRQICFYSSEELLDAIDKLYHGLSNLKLEVMSRDAAFSSEKEWMQDYLEELKSSVYEIHYRVDKEINKGLVYQEPKEKAAGSFRLRISL